MYQLLNFYWKYLPESKKYIPTMSWFDFDKSEKKIIELPNFRFNLKFSKEKHCTGYSSETGYHSCPANNIISNNQSQCLMCEELEGFKVAFFMGGKPNNAMKSFMQKEHLLYLAYFEPGIVKVGTAAISRKEVRPIEQDALIYCYIGQSDGYNIQKIERYISKSFNITEFVKSSHKSKFIDHKPNLERAKELFFRYIDRIYYKLDSAKQSEFNFTLLPKEDVTIVDLSKESFICYPKNFQFIKEENVVYGEFRGLRGKNLIIDFDQSDYIFDINFLIGRTIEYIEEYKYNKQDQISLDI